MKKQYLVEIEEELVYMDVKKQKDLLEGYRQGDLTKLDLLVEHYYEKVGERYIQLYPNKKNKEAIARELCRLLIVEYSQSEKINSPLTAYINNNFARKYEKFEIGHDIDGNKNKIIFFKSYIKKALSNPVEFEKLYQVYYYIIDRYIKLYPNKENCAKELFRETLIKFLESDETRLAEYIKRQFSKNYETYEIGNKLKELTSKTPVADLIEEARYNLEARNKLIIKYMYIVEENILNIEGFEKEELRAIGCLKLVEYVNGYFENESNYPLSSYLKTAIKDYFEAYQKARSLEEVKQKQQIEIDFVEDFTTCLIENTDLLEVIKNTNLDQRERTILYYVGAYGYTFEELGKKYNISKSRAQQIYQRTIEKVLEQNRQTR